MQKVTEEWKEWKDIRGIRLIAAAAVMGLALLLLGPKLSREQEPEGTESVDGYFSVQFYTEYLEERIGKLCCQIGGIHEAHVLLTLDGSSEYVYAENRSGAARDYVILQGSGAENPLLVQEIYPEIRGVAVVCTRGDDSAVRLAVTELLSAALGIPASAIRVAGT